MLYNVIGNVLQIFSLSGNSIEKLDSFQIPIKNVGIMSFEGKLHQPLKAGMIDFPRHFLFTDAAYGMKMKSTKLMETYKWWIIRSFRICSADMFPMFFLKLS